MYQSNFPFSLLLHLYDTDFHGITRWLVANSCMLLIHYSCMHVLSFTFCTTSMHSYDILDFLTCATLYLLTLHARCQKKVKQKEQYDAQGWHMHKQVTQTIWGNFITSHIPFLIQLLYTSHDHFFTPSHSKSPVGVHAQDRNQLVMTSFFSMRKNTVNLNDVKACRNDRLGHPIVVRVVYMPVHP